jgi:hypothetical protein
MKAFTSDMHGRNHYSSSPKEHKLPKSSIDRKGTRSSKRQQNKSIIAQELNQGQGQMS